MKKKKFKPKHSPDFMFHTVKHLVKIYAKHKFNIKQIGQPLTKADGPFFLIGHHVTAFDAPIAGSWAPIAIRFIAGDANYDNKTKKFWLDLAGAIPFTKNTSDVKSIMKLKRLAKHGKSISLYPEGGRNWDGSTDELIPSTAKLIKMLKLPVYTIFYYGGYMSKPRWAQYFRKGLMEIEYKLLIKADDIKSLSVEEIIEIMTTGLTYNEYEWQRKRMIPYKGKNLAEHVERLVYKCPECDAIDCFSSEGNDFSCNRCGATYQINEYGFIENCEAFDNLTDWNAWQRTFLPSIIDEGFELTSRDIEIDFIHKVTNKHKKRLCNITLSEESLTIETEGAKKIIPIKDIKGLSITFLDTVEMFVGDEKLRFDLDPTRHTSVKLFYDLLKFMKH